MRPSAPWAAAFPGDVGGVVPVGCSGLAFLCVPLRRLLKRAGCGPAPLTQTSDTWLSQKNTQALGLILEVYLDPTKLLLKMTCQQG